MSDLPLLAPLTLDELRGYSDIQGASKGTQLERCLAAAILFCQAYTRRIFQPDPALVVEGDSAPADTADPVTKPVLTEGRRRVRVPDVREITTLTIDGVESTDYTLQPDGYGRPAPKILLPARGTVKIEITGRFGFLDVPSDVRDAIYTDAIRRYKGRDASYADRVDTPDGMILSYFRALPATVQASYNDLRVPSDFFRFL